MAIGKSDEAMRTIGEVAEKLDLPPHVLRFWETRFKELDPVKRAGGRRYYRPRDVELLMALRHLLYGQGYTIKGAQRILSEQGARAVVESLRAGTFRPGFAGPGPDAPPENPPERQAAEPPSAAPPPSPAPVVEPRPAQLPAVIAQPAQMAQAGLDEEQERALRLSLADLAEARRLLLLTKD
jgi:DNA-binding transcriptional MerR regulator